MRRSEIWGITKIRETWGEDARHFLVELHVELQLDGSKGGEAFRVMVLSPAMLVEELSASSGCESGRGYVFMNDYDEPTLRAWLQKLVDASGATTWDELRMWIERWYDWVD